MDEAEKRKKKKDELFLSKDLLNLARERGFPMAKGKQRKWTFLEGEEKKKRRRGERCFAALEKKEEGGGGLAIVENQE